MRRRRPRTTSRAAGARRGGRAAPRRWPDVVAPDPLVPRPRAAGRGADGSSVRRGDRRGHAGVPRRGGRRARRACPDGFAAAGAFETIASEVAIANTEGQFCWAPSTMASLTTVVTGGERRAAGSPRRSRGVGRVDRRGRSGGAPRARPSQSQAPQRPRAGALHRSCSSPRPSSTLVGFLAWIGFGGRSSSRGARASRARRGGRSPRRRSRSATTPRSAGTLGAAVRLRGRAALARRPDQGRRVPRRGVRPADREAGGTSHRPATRSLRRTPRGRSRSTCSWSRASASSRR